MGPIAVELVAQPPASDSQAQTLIASCSGAAGPEGCELAGADELRGEGTVRAIVTFGDGYARVRVEARLPWTRPDGVSASRVAVREAVFREGDPLLERFRAAGLIVAGLVADLSPQTRTARVVPAGRPAAAHVDSAPPIAAPTPEHDTVESPPAVVATVPQATLEDTLPAAAPPHRWPVALSLAAVATAPADRMRLGAALDGDFPLASSPIFITTHASYQQTSKPDAQGISTLGGTLGVGAGVSLRIPLYPVWVRARARAQVERLQVAVDQPGPGDAESVLLPGLGADAELVWAISPLAGVFAGVRLDWTDDEVAVSVAGKPSEVISPWAGSLGFGATVWLP